MDLINNSISNILKDILKTISRLGTVEFFIIIIFITYTLEFEKLTKQLIVGLLIMTFIAIPIRYYLFKERPNKIKYSNFLEKIKASSFPSMHSARFGFIVTAVYISTKNISLLFVLLSLFGLLVFQRVYEKKHDMYDIIGGIILALTTLLFIVNIKGF